MLKEIAKERTFIGNKITNISFSLKDTVFFKNKFFWKNFKKLGRGRLKLEIFRRYERITECKSYYDLIRTAERTEE